MPRVISEQKQETVETIKITLDDNPNKVTNHPLISFTFDGKTYKQTSYIQMLLEVINLLDKIKPGKLEALVHADNWPQSYKLAETPDELLNPERIKDNIFIQKKIGASTVLKAIKKFLEEFDVTQSSFYALISRSIW